MGVCIFLDNSNIFITSQNVCEEKEGLTGYGRYNPIRLHFINLMQLAGAGREVTGSYSVSSESVQGGYVRNSLEGLTGVTSTVLERGVVSGSEQAVDETLQLNMYRTLANESEPGVAVLMTGDGKGFEKGVGFLKALYDMHAHGWGVEVLSWESSCHRDLRSFAEENGVFVPLDRYYFSVTYVPNGRRATPLSLVGRKCARPDLERSAEARLVRSEERCAELEARLAQKAGELEALSEENRRLARTLEETGRRKEKYVKGMKRKERKEKEKAQEKVREEASQPVRIPPETLAGLPPMAYLRTV